ncbi:hypothetical protein ARMGADRAFT_1075624 [Armillaria gallica]|uniref:Thioester reductase (TE) domain-containing protein n=1 Tax=Armillaria gallica TaxID=47427 RepID=A0A2H3DXM9_ARMGA|nr:hypothetical protein ARMGADRAFT_1075624 [Armillaria gallica]
MPPPNSFPYSPGQLTQCRNAHFAPDFPRPSAFHFLLAVFIVLLHPCAGETDIAIGSSSTSAKDPLALVLRIPADPLDPFWAEFASDTTDDEGPKGLVHGIRNYSIPTPFVPLIPNGKVDKPAIPFPDTVQSATAAPKATSTEEKMPGLKLLGPRQVFHSRYPTHFRHPQNLRSTPLGLIFDEPTISGLVKAVEALRDADLGLTITTIEYGKDYDRLLPKLREAYPPLPSDFATKPIMVFLTQLVFWVRSYCAFCFLRCERVKKVIYLVRASDRDDALARLKEGSTDQGVWDEEWVKAGRLEVLTGDLNLDNLGLGEEEWNRVAEEADAILHDGALIRTFF